MIIMKSSEDNDNRYLGILKGSNRLCAIKSKAIGNEAYLYIKLFNAPKDNCQVIIEDKDRRISNRRLASLIPVKLNVSSYDKGGKKWSLRQERNSLQWRNKLSSW